MTIDFYCVPAGAPSRSVLMLSKILGVELNQKHVDLRVKKEQLKPEFIKINPQHCVPTLVDDGFSIWESRAILVYLVEKYAKDDSLLPKDPQKKAVVIQRLFFDALSMYQAFADVYYPILMNGAAYDEEKGKKLHSNLEFLEGFLKETGYAAGNHLTIADISLLATVTTFEAVGVDLSKYTNIQKWLSKIPAEIPDYKEANEKGIEDFKAYFLKARENQ